ncbi:MAG TPA: phosphotransferase [Herpetosiphonaceae bacterium]
MTHPSLSVEAIAAHVAAAYAWPAPPAVSLIRDGQAASSIYRVEAADGPRILRVYGPPPHSAPGWIAAELAMLSFLERQGLAVAAPCPQADGSLMLTISDGAAARPAALFAFADGSPRWPPTEAESFALGAALARIHGSLDAFAIPPGARTYDAAQLIDRPLSLMLPFVPAAADQAFLRELGAEIGAALAAIPQAAPWHGMLHGDVHQGNVHFDDAGAPTFFDFALCGAGWRVFDFTGFLWPLRDDSIGQPGVRAACREFLAGYESVRPLAPAERAAIGACVRARDFWETADWIASDQGAESAVFEDWLRTLLERFRRGPVSLDALGAD